MAVNWQRTVMRAIGAREQAVTVTNVHDLLPHYRQIRFFAPQFMTDRDFYPTMWVRLWVPALEDPALLRQRGYTLVDPDPETHTFALEFIIHEPTGAASTWAVQAEPGDTAEIAFTPAKIAPDPAIGGYLLLGDTSALPAINSLLDAAPPGTATHVIFVDDHHNAEQLPFRLKPDTHLTVVASGAEQVQRLRTLDIDRDDVYVWAAGERRDVASIRAVVRGEWNLPKHRQHTQYYWIRGKAFG